MNYNQGINQMLNLSGTSGSFSPYGDITITYPGYKKSGDYRLSISNGQVVPTHGYISTTLYNLIVNNSYTFYQLENLLNDIYYNGTNTHYCDVNLEYLKHLIFWVTLQEEINFPRRNGYAGINLPFCRYFEAIYSTQPHCNFTILDVQARCNNHGGPKPLLYNITNSPTFYHY